ncbi:hypothetical protein B5808_00410 [Cnuibacter physcomitrellae]|uniref:Uncharacterized protein n=1 Tax=Cnuibacter physcomitrellae TaxID=1619308 RepID=A0A1X9LF98_9MICO|nr:hypothetical protein B5808_00410 [Cnuibacter physcomitrellae]
MTVTRTAFAPAGWVKPFVEQELADEKVVHWKSVPVVPSASAAATVAVESWAEGLPAEMLRRPSDVGVVVVVGTVAGRSGGAAVSELTRTSCPA